VVCLGGDDEGIGARYVVREQIDAQRVVLTSYPLRAHTSGREADVVEVEDDEVDALVGVI